MARSFGIHCIVVWCQFTVLMAVALGSFSARDSAETSLITQAILDEATASMRGEMVDMLAELKKTVADNSEATAQLQEASSNNFTNVQKQQ